jgi:hypothetical protein
MQNRVLYSPALLPLLLLCPLAALISCGGSSASSSTPAPATVYVAGESGGISQYWTNGVSTQLASSGVVSGIAIAGTDVYVAGAAVPTSGTLGVAAYWKNGTVVRLAGTTPSIANGIAVSYGYVYVSGGVEDGTNPGATVWINGVATQLADGVGQDNIANPTSASSLFVYGSDVYVAGVAEECILTAPLTDYCGGVAVYWKNGTPTDLVQLTNGAPNTNAFSIYVSGSDVYVTGSSYTISGNPPMASNITPMVWKNGQAITLPASLTEVQSVFVNGSDVYLAGACGSSPCYALNGVVQLLPNANSTSTGTNEASHLVVSGSDVYVAGATRGSAAYWVDGTLYLLNSSASGYANSIAVVPD